MGSIVAGHAIVDQNVEFPPHSIIAGVPAKRIADRDCSAANRVNARLYHAIAERFAYGEDRLDEARLAEPRAAAEAHR